MTVRTMFIIGPDKKVKLLFVYPMATGRLSGWLAGAAAILAGKGNGASC
jgi:alkyl hydroperoxide reductase subunit AhpC